ncbi:MAG: hypothetical protein AUG75_02050 [Cyanobacteria bacterium 13_1_20CM_4_61_6]|nr:MAG: hypothetical protein AUG75_02050 [Cyanobacteria bacterium 13_1_20CM_4_61_6]
MINELRKSQERIGIMKPNKNSPEKKPYDAPKFQIYGDLMEMTKTGGTGMSDKGMSSSQLT